MSELREQHRPLCIYHGNCADGFTAAWAVWKRFGNAGDYVAANYGAAPPDVAGRDVIIVDFSYNRDVLMSMLRSGNTNQAMTILVLDHHKTAAEDLEGLLRPGEGWGGGNGYDPVAWRQGWETAAEWPVRAVFDMARSGAGITWDFFHPDKPRPPLVNYVEDRDLWRFALPQSRDFSANLFSLAYDFHAWDRVAKVCEDQQKLQAFLDEGAAIERKHHKDVAELVAAFRREMIIGGHWVPVANLPYTLTSDAGNLMCKPYASPNLQGDIVTPPFAACYWDQPEGRVFSLRSIDGGADVSEVAKQYGGGGHKNAAGFRLPHGVQP